MSAAIEHALDEQERSMVNCPFCGVEMDHALVYESLDNIKFRRAICFKCKGRIDVKQTYADLAEFFQSLAKIYNDKATDEE